MNAQIELTLKVIERIKKGTDNEDVRSDVDFGCTNPSQMNAVVFQRLQALVITDGPHDRLQPGPVQPDEAGDELLGDTRRLRTATGPEFGEQRLDARPGILGVDGVGHVRSPA